MKIFSFKSKKKNATSKMFFSLGKKYVVSTRFECPFRIKERCISSNCDCNIDFPKKCPLEDIK